MNFSQSIVFSKLARGKQKIGEFLSTGQVLSHAEVWDMAQLHLAYNVLNLLLSHLHIVVVWIISCHGNYQ